MKNFTPIEKLDLILSIFSSEKELLTFDELDRKINTEKYGHYVPKDELRRVLRKLLDDNLIVEHEVVGSPVMRYHISFDGYLFHGYEKQIKVDETNAIIASRNERRIIRNERLLIIGLGPLQ